MYLVKEYLASIAGVHVYAIIAMAIFFTTFIFMVYHAYSMKKKDANQFSRLPLEDEADENSVNN